MTDSGRRILETAWSALGREPAELGLVSPSPRRVPLDAATDVGALAWGAVAAASLAACRLSGDDVVAPSPARIAVAFTSERHLMIDDVHAQPFAPLSGFFRTADAWVRTHANYAWHAAALRSTLALRDDASAADAAGALRLLNSRDAVAQVTAAGGVCREVRHADAAVDSALREQPIVRVARIGDAPRHPRPAGPRAAPLRGIRVLDLTRVIAGPVATRTLALLGADVLRVDPPARPEIAWQHLDTGHGKRSTVLDARTAAFDALLAAADVLVLGYRPAGLAALGLSPAAIAARRPGIVIAQLSAWGSADERGFDSIVQAESGIAWIESADGTTPGALPAQALDHSAGYLLAAAVLTLLARRAETGGTWIAETSLRRIAAELLALPRSRRAAPAPAPDPVDHIQRFRVEGRTVTTAAPALAYTGGPEHYTAPRPWAADPPAWAP